MTSYERSLGSAAVYGAIGLLAMVGIIYATPNGPGVSYDSTQYLAAARNLLAGNGLSVPSAPDKLAPLTHFPPMYPAAVALFGAVVGDVRLGASILNVVAIVATTVLVGRLAEAATNSDERAKHYAGLCAAIATAIATDLVVDARMVWSETTFTAFVLATLLLLVRAIERQGSSAVRDDASILPAAVAASLATLTRYAGISVIGACAIAIVLTSRFGWWIGLRRAVVFGLASAIPLVLWFVRNIVLAHTAANREISAHLISSAGLLEGIKTLTRWFIPYVPFGAGRMLPVALMVGLVVYLIYRTVNRTAAITDSSARAARFPQRSRASLTIYIVTIFLITYGVFLLVSISFADADTRLDARILSPAIPPVLAMAVGAAFSVLFRSPGATGSLGQPRRTRLRIAAGAAFTVYCGSHIASLIEWSRTARTQGLGLAPVAHSAEGLLAAVREMPPSARLYSNIPGLIYASTDRVAYDLPWHSLPGSLRTNLAFAAQLDAIADDDIGGPAYIVFFDAASADSHQATISDARSRLTVIDERFFDGGEIALVGRR